MTTKTKQPTRAQLERQLTNANDALEMALSVSAITDNNFFGNNLSGLYGGDRGTWDRKKIFAESLRAWRVNPIARRIVRLMTSFIIGKGIAIKCEDETIQKFLTEWWTHPLNKFDRQVKRWKDEETRTGNLFFLFSIAEDGMSFVRAVPAEQIEEILTKENDVEQEVRYTKDAIGDDSWDAYDPSAERQTTFMLHYASNQPVGSVWGEADLSPLLVWIGRFSSWLEDRVRLNKFRTAFMYVIQGAYSSETERQTREKQLNANPPKSGSVLVTNSQNGEQWGILNANLDAFDASMDGAAIKKMIASGVGFPMHWLAEPEGSTRTTAEAAGTPSFRTLEEAQNDFFDMIIDMARIALRVKGLDHTAKIQIDGPDITERDNASLALAFSRAYISLSDMYDRDLIDETELKGISFRMMAEPFEGKAPKGKKKPLTAPGTPAAGTESVTDPSDPKEEEESNSAWVDDLQKFLTTNTSAPIVNITNQMPEQKEPIITVTNQVQTPSVTVQNQIPEQATPIVNVSNQVETPIVNIENQIPSTEAPIVHVHNEVETPVINIENQVETPAVNIESKAAPNMETEPALPKRKRKK